MKEVKELRDRKNSKNEGWFTSQLFGAMKRAGTITVNNQNDILLQKHIGLTNFVLHDNRIFIFSHERKTLFSKKVKTDTSSPEQSVILNIFTTRGFRLLRAIYFLFRLLDNTALVVVIILTVTHGKLTQPTNSQYAIYSVIGVELFYDVMLNVNKYWGLQRLSCLIGIIIFALYYLALNILEIEDAIDYEDYIVSRNVVTFRLGVFILEEMVDIGIDLCLHNTLLQLNEIREEATKRSKKIFGDEIREKVRQRSLSLQVPEPNPKRSLASIDFQGGDFALNKMEGLSQYHALIDHESKTGNTKDDDPSSGQNNNNSLTHDNSEFKSNLNNLQDNSQVIEQTSNPLYPDEESTRESYFSSVSMDGPREELIELQMKKCIIPDSIKYEGSFFAWGTGTVKSWEKYHYKKEYPTWIIFSLLITAGIPALVLGAFLSILFMIAAFLSYIIYTIFSFLFKKAHLTWNPSEYFEELVDP